MTQSIRKTILLVVVSTMLGGCAELGIELPRAGMPEASTNNPGAANRSPVAEASITAAQARRLARELGLTGFRPLPPGIARNLARGKALPPGIAKRCPPLAMLDRLPRIAGHEWQIAGTDLVLVAIATLIVIDILEDVF